MEKKRWRERERERDRERGLDTMVVEPYLSRSHGGNVASNCV